MKDISDVFKGELVLTKDSKNQQKILKDKEALAQCIQNIIFMEKGTDPNQPELGVGIENYLFEKATEETLENLKLDIIKQVEQFIPNMNKVDVEVETKKTDKYVSLLIAISIATNSSFQDETLVALVVGKSSTTDKVISQLIVG
jgi:phage baseplate assembly protein W